MTINHIADQAEIKWGSTTTPTPRRVLLWIFVAVVGLGLWMMATTSTTTGTPDRCESLWRQFRNTGANVGVSHSDYVSQCRSDERQINQLSSDHR